jgi:hypothetical protein
MDLGYGGIRSPRDLAFRFLRASENETTVAGCVVCSSNSFFFFFFSTKKGLSKTRLSSLFSSRKKKVMKVKNPTLLHPPVCSDCYTSCAPRSRSRSLRKTKEKSLAIDPIARVFVCVCVSLSFSLSLGRHLGFLLLLLPRSHGTCCHWPLACSPLTLQLFPPGHRFVDPRSYIEIASLPH